MEGEPPEGLPVHDDPDVEGDEKGASKGGHARQKGSPRPKGSMPDDVLERVGDAKGASKGGRARQKGSPRPKGSMPDDALEAAGDAKGASKGGRARQNASGSPRPKGSMPDDTLETADDAKGQAKGAPKGGRGRWHAAGSPRRGLMAEDARDSKGGSKGRSERHHTESQVEQGEGAALDAPVENACGQWSWSSRCSRRPPSGSEGRESTRQPGKYGKDCRRKDDEEHCAQFSHPKPCSFFARGVCTRGDRCPFLHVQPAEDACLEGATIGGRTQGGKPNTEVFEEVLAETSGVRAVYGQGGEVTTILFPDECISVVVRVQAGVTEDDLRAQLSRYGELRGLRFEGKGKGGKVDGGAEAKGSGKGISTVAFVTFMAKASAAQLLGDWHSLAGVLGAEAGGVRPPPPTKPITGCLVVKWDVGDWFENISDDEDGFDSKPWTCTACTLENPVDVLKCGACEQSCPRRVTRRALDDALQKSVPLLDEGPEMELTYYVKKHFDRTYHNRGCRVHYAAGAEDVQRALRAWRPNPPHFASAPEPVKSFFKTLHCHGEFFAAVFMDRALFDWWATQEPDELKAALEAVKRDGVFSTINRKTRGNVGITLRGQSIPQLKKAREGILKVIACDFLSHPCKDLLFTAPGQKRLRDFPFCVRTEFRTRTVRMYGTQDARKCAEEALLVVLTALGTLARLDFTLQVKDIDQAKLKNDLELAEDLELRGRRLTLWVSAGREDMCREYMDRWVWKKSMGAGELCALCFCEFDEAKHQLLGCGHTFCTGCLENCLREPSASHFPLLCQGPSPVVEGEAPPCKQPICWADLVRLAPPESLAALKAIAVQAYLLENPGEGMYCGGITGSGCNALVRPEHGQVACAQCGEEYCVNCSSLLKKVVALHPTTTCEEAQLAERLGVQEIRRRIIDEFLTIRCPKCATAFEDFSACACITCASCNTHFCGKCINFYSDNSAEAHAHVKKCTDDGALKADDRYHIPLDEWHKNNLRRAQNQVERFLKTLDSELRDAVIHACELDFSGRPGGDLVISPELFGET